MSLVSPCRLETTVPFKEVSGNVKHVVSSCEVLIDDLIVCLHQRKPIRIDSIEQEYLSLREKEKEFRYMW